MIHLQKLTTTSILKWVSSYLFENHIRISETPFQQNLWRFYRRKTNGNPENYVGKVSPAIRTEAEAALLEYLHSTRALQFIDAEHMSKNSPHFLQKILKKVKCETDIFHSIVRFLRYHPINEFEPFFESAGLKPSEYKPLLPKNLMFLSDDDLLLENYHVLCNYGVKRSKIGNIFKEAMEVFRYDFGVLSSKLQAYKELGLSQSFIGKVVVCSPYLLTGDIIMEIVEVIEILKTMGIECSWIEEHLEWYSCDWSKMLSFLSLFSQFCSGEKQLGSLIRQHPGLLFEGSGDRALTLIGLLLKFGCTMSEIFSILLQFPQMHVAKFVLNLRQCVQFLHEIEMEKVEIGNIIRSQPVLLGSCTLKKTGSLHVLLGAGKRRLCEHIQENPQEIKKWVLGTRVQQLQSSKERQRSKSLKYKFLLDLGFVENSKKMEKALKLIRGRGEELPERFDCIVKAGLDRKDVCEMIGQCPQILNQTKGVIETKIDFLVNGLGYPISYLLHWPKYLYFTVQRTKLRFLIFRWLVDQGAVNPMLSMDTLMSCSDKEFIRRFVNRHPACLKLWQKWNAEICTK